VAATPSATWSRARWKATSRPSPRPGAKPQIHFVNPTQVTDALKKIAGWIKLTDEFIEDADFLKSEIDNRLLYKLGYFEEQQLLNGPAPAPRSSAC
jgi:hypothetical protein